MGKGSMDLLELLRKGCVGCELDYLREALRLLLEAFMDAGVSARIGVVHGERNPDRLTHRNGYSSLAPDARSGTIDQRIPKLSGLTIPNSIHGRLRCSAGLVVGRLTVSYLSHQ